MKAHERIIRVLVLSIFLFVKLSIAQTNKVSLLNFSMSTCDSDSDPEKLTTHIEGQQLNGDTLVIEIATVANCCAKFKPKVLFENNVLFLDAEPMNGDYCFCDCCFGLVYQIKGISNKNIHVNFRRKPVYLDLKKHESYFGRFQILNGDTIFTVTEVQPLFPGGLNALSSFISEKLQYPTDAKSKKIQGKVFVEFIVRKTGVIDKNSIKVIKGVNSSLDDEAVRLVKLFPIWEPALHDGMPVNSRYVLPIRFAITK